MNATAYSKYRNCFSSKVRSIGRYVTLPIRSSTILARPLHDVFSYGQSNAERDEPPMAFEKLSGGYAHAGKLEMITSLWMHRPKDIVGEF
jgi:hypothetical protein